MLLKMEAPTATDPFTSLNTTFKEGFAGPPEIFTGKKLTEFN